MWKDTEPSGRKGRVRDLQDLRVESRPQLVEVRGELLSAELMSRKQHLLVTSKVTVL